MTTALLALALASPACDWQVTRKVDPMTDQASCLITSPSAHLALSVSAKEVRFVTGSIYRNDYLTVRVDDREAIMLGKGRSTSAYSGEARTLLDQILTGVRIRVTYRSEPDNVSGEAAICNLPELIRSCR